MAKKKLMDMDDILLKTKELLRTDRHVCEIWQRQFPYIMIDEFQDISPLQFDCMRLLSGSSMNLFAVGDDDQAIYRFRGARPELMLGFDSYFPGAGRILLETNYRCPKTVTDAAGRVIANNRQRFEKQIVAANRGGEKIVQKAFSSVQEEARYVAKWAERYIKCGAAPDQLAVLFRNHRQAASLMGQLTLHKIPYVMKEQMGDIFEHWLVRDLVSYIHIAEGRFTYGEFLSVMNRPNRFLSRERVAAAAKNGKTRFSLDTLSRRLAHWPGDSGAIALWQEQNRLLKELPPYGAVQYIRRVMDYDGFVAEYAQRTGTELQEYTDILDDFASAVGSFSDWEQYRQFLADRKRLEKKKTAKDAPDAIRLSTMHGAKGLEFDDVLILDVNEGITPYGRMGVIEDLEEERRLFYVAMTRAKKRLQLLFVKNEEQKLQPSRFLGEAFYGEQKDQLLKSSSSSSMISSYSLASSHSSKASSTISYSSSSTMFSRTGS